jgi:hypothetical protein
MDSSSPIDQLIAQLAPQLTQRTRRGAVAASPQAATGLPDAGPRDEGGDMSAEQAVRERIAALRASGVDDPAELSRAMIEALLGRTFSVTLMRDRKFQRMVDAVHQTITGNPQGRAMMEQVLMG